STSHEPPDSRSSTLSLHDALPIWGVEDIRTALPPGWHDEAPALCIVLVARLARVQAKYRERAYRFVLQESGHIAQNLVLAAASLDRKSTRLNSCHLVISYAVFCLK